MEPEELFGTLLALGECWWVKGVIYQESLRRFVIEIEETDQLWSHEAAPGMGAMCVCMTTLRRDSGDISMCLTTNACFNARCPVPRRFQWYWHNILY